MSRSSISYQRSIAIGVLIAFTLFILASKISCTNPAYLVIDPRQFSCTFGKNYPRDIDPPRLTPAPTKRLAPTIVLTPTVTTIPDPPDEIVSPEWKIHRNLAAGYSINYPAHWYNRSYTQDRFTRYFSNRNPEAEVDTNLFLQKDEVLVVVRAGTEDDIFHAPAKLFEISPGESFEQNFFIYSKRADLVVNGLPAVRYTVAVSPDHPGTEPQSPYDTFWAIRKGPMFGTIDALLWDKTRYDKYYQLIETMASSFRFTR